MNREDIIRMAREAGFADSNGVVHAAYQLESFAALVASAERERTWVGLTPEEVMESWEEIRDGDWAPDFYAVIEAKLKEKNT